MLYNRKIKIKVFHHRLIITRWAKCFVLLDSWTICCPVLGSRHGVLANTWPCPPAWHRSTAVQSAFPYMVMLTVRVRRWRFCSTLTDDTCLPPPFSYLGMITVIYDIRLLPVISTASVFGSRLAFYTLKNSLNRFSICRGIGLIDEQEEMK